MNFSAQQFHDSSVRSGFETLANDRMREWLRRHDRQDTKRISDIRLQERQRERERIARDLHDTLLQEVFGASMLLHSIAENLPENAPCKLAMLRVVRVIERVLENTRATLTGLRSPDPCPGSLEDDFSRVRAEFAPESNVAFRMVVTGKPEKLEPAVREQVHLIGREALVNALRHSGAMKVEVGIEYSVRRLRLLIRDNGRGIDPQVLRSGRDSHWGLMGMRERADEIGAKLRIWSKPGAGTEIELSVQYNMNNK